MAPERRRCRETTKDGEPCGAPSRFVDPRSGLCPAHDPEHREELLRAARKGGRSTARRWARGGLTDADLPPLESREDARAWLRVCARAVATGKLTAREGEVLRETVDAFLRALDGGDGGGGPDALDRYVASRYGSDGNGSGEGRGT